MGNSTSGCFLLHSSSKAKLFDGNENLKQLNLPIKAAEIMLEEPGHVVSPLDELSRTHRVSAMRADDDLLAGKLYVLVPVGRLHRKFSGEEIGIIEAAVCRRKGLFGERRRGKMSGAKVLPAVSEEVKKEEESEEKDFVGTDTGFSGHRFRNLRQWNPVLEAISEVY